MDAYQFRFERTSKLDLHPLSLPVSRLSPAKSSSSIDQFTHHHSKGDSAYSSFSGGSTVPDYPSPFLLDELQSQSLHYSDLKHVKAKQSPSLDSDSKRMDHIYRSMELIEQPHWSGSGFTVLEHPLVHTGLTPPACLNSFVIRRNLENSTARQSPEGQHANISHSPQVTQTFSQLSQDRGDLILDSATPAGNLNTPPIQTFSPEPPHYSWSSQSGTLRKRSHSAHISERRCLVPQNKISGSIQHKGQFFYVTGVFKADPIKNPSEWSSNGQSRRRSCPSSPSGKLFYQEEHNLKLPNEQHFVIPEDQMVSSRETSWNDSRSHPIFYCGPEDNFDGVVMTPALIKEDGLAKRDETVVLGRSPLDIPTNKISKETTPLLYHLTGANRVSYASKSKDQGDFSADFSIKHQQEAVTDEKIVPDAEHWHSEEQPTEFYYQCGTLDDSYKKYYKERLKDVQSKVLRETSFKRRDLQLSQPNRFKQHTDKLLLVINAGTPSQDMPSKLNTFHKPQETNITDTSQGVTAKEPKITQNIAQPQVPRIGSRKRLTADQKKLSHSEPEKLHQLTEGPTHTTSHSLGNELEALLSESDQGLVSARRKLFETRARTMSASMLSKSTLKHLQHKALVAYMERKTGQKVAEASSLLHQLPSVEKAADWTSRWFSDSKKTHRPLSAGQILDSVSSSVKHKPFTSMDQSTESTWREASSTTGRSASVESLLEQPEQPILYRTQSTSTPHAFQVRKQLEDFAGLKKKALSSIQRKEQEGVIVHHRHAASVPAEWQVHVRASRGWSMEEIGSSSAIKAEACIPSSEQLDQIQCKKSTETEERDPQILSMGGNRESSLAESIELTRSLTHAEIPNVLHGVQNQVTDASKPCSGDDALQLDASKEQRCFPQDKNEMCNPSQEVSLSHGATADPCTSSSSEVNKEENTIHPLEEPALDQPQTAQLSLSEEKAFSPITSLCGTQEVESEQMPAFEKLEEKTNSDEGQLADETEVEKLDWASLVQEVVLADQSLARTLYPVANRKTALMLMEQLLSEDSLLMEEHYKKKLEQNEANQAIHGTDLPVRESEKDARGILQPFKDRESILKNQADILLSPEKDLIEKKRLLIAHLQHQLEHLEVIRSSLQTDEQVCGLKAEAMETVVRESCVSLELERYTLFLADLERVIRLLLCLCTRLARVQNALSTADHHSMDAEERESLDSRYLLLCKQRDDAKDLKENLNRRERQVWSFLQKQLDHTQMHEYTHLIQSKASLLIRLSELQESQRLVEEQLQALISSLPA